MAEIVYMPKLSDTMTEGVVATWNKNVGDTVKAGEVLAEIETDKATMEFESFYDGVLLHIGVETGQAAPVNSILAIIGQAGEDISAALASAGANAPGTVAEAPKTETAPTPAPVASPAASTRPRAARPSPSSSSLAGGMRRCRRAAAEAGRWSTTPRAKKPSTPS